MALSLSGLTIVEGCSPAAPPALAAAISLCGHVAGQLGATVLRWLPEGQEEDAADPAIRFLHAGKRAMRGGQAEDPSLLAAMLGGADAAVLDLSLAERLAAGPGPRAVLSMDGTTDPWQSEFTIEARSGLLDVVGDPLREPLRLGGHQTAYAAGLSAFTGLVGALCGREDRAAHEVRVSLLETAIWLNWKNLAVADRTGIAPRRRGGEAEWPVVPCADGHVALVYRFQEWPRMLQVVTDPAIREERFQSIEGRRIHRVALNAILARHFAPMTRAEVKALSLTWKLPFGPVWNTAEIRDDPQMRVRDVFTAVEEGVVPRLPVLWSGERLHEAAA
jgi:hypothetical protein